MTRWEVGRALAAAMCAVPPALRCSLLTHAAALRAKKQGGGGGAQLRCMLCVSIKSHQMVHSGSSPGP